MNVKDLSLRIFQIVLCGFGIVATFYTIMELMYFLSVPKRVEPYKPGTEIATSWALLINMSLLSLFILQHSLLASNNVKEAFQANGFQSIHRIVYIITTSGILLYILKHWTSTPAVFWTFNFNYKPIWWVFISIHITAWLVIYIGNICCDFPDLLGIKQIYYSMVNSSDPNFKKSPQLQRLNSHMRHPSFLAFALILWLSPVMSLDRILMATILTAYMYIAWNTDGSDFHYQKYQLERKHFRLDHF